MPICKFFLTKDGCLRGDKCYFEHAQPGQLGTSQNTAATAKTIDEIPRKSSKTPFADRPDPLAKVSCRFFKLGTCKNADECRFRHDTTSEETNPHESNTLKPSAGTPTTDLPDPLAQISCRFYKLGLCKNGDQCRFLHDVKDGEQILQEPSPEEETREKLPSEPENSKNRDLGGALVKFGDGGDVVSIKPAASSTGRLQMCNVSCVWYQPSKVATLEFTSSHSMQATAQKLGKTRILDRTLTCRTIINKNVKPWQCFVKVGNLDISTTTKDLKWACGQRQPRNVIFGDNSYSSNAEEIGQAIQRLIGNVDAWTVSANTKGPQIKATATFPTAEHATKAIADFNGYKLPQIGGSKIFLSHMVKAKFSILTAMHTAISPELASVQRSLASKNYLEIKSYPSADKSHRFTTLHIISTTAHEVGRAKAAVEKILSGHTARGGKGIIWHEFFLKPEGMTYLNGLGKQHDVFIYRNAKKLILSLYGNDENKAIVESALIKIVGDLATSSFNIDVDSNLKNGVYQAAYRKMIGKLGKTAVRLKVKPNSITITIHGSSQDAIWAEAVLRKESDRACAIGSNTEESLTCAVCWCDVTEAYTTSCGHSYDTECFANQCLSSGDENIPLKCLGSLGKCQAILSFSELETALTRDQLDQLLQRSFTRYIRTHANDYQYCPTADCDQVYKLTRDGNIFTCSTCLTSICTTCGAVSHEGLTCEQHKNAMLGDDAFAEWKEKNDARDCPKCGCTIQKLDGCNHMQCRACGAHICWVCMETFDKGTDTYDHMKDEHGGFYDAGYGD